MNKATLLLVTAALFSATGCQHLDKEVQPSSYDALALETGHWEWESTAYMAGKRTPATEGYSRQLVFGANGQVLIYHGSKLNKTTTYALSMGTSCANSQTQVPIIAYETDSDVPNSDRKTYSLTKLPTGQSLSLVGEAVCLDVGAYEAYHWVKE
ncbi:MAG: hypothetical protein ACRYG7_02260 [Janthinobacterium lividum]